LVVCEKDRILPAPRFSRHFTNHLPKDSHQVTKLDGVGHVPMFEAPGRVTEVITSFIEERCPSPGREQPTG
jgi:pimeloyl-ACP methyl ester carboxylesterase